MNIALIAHDAKKELLAQFCIAYCGILSRHKLFATGATGKMVSGITGLEIITFMGGAQGGAEQISSRIALGEIDLLFFFRDSDTSNDFNRNDNDLVRLCDRGNIPYATNLATAEALIHALERGDLDWRELWRDKNRPPKIY